MHDAYLFIGDAQENIPLARTLLRANRPEHLVFLGDYFDSWKYQPVHHADFFLELKEAVETGKATALLGNHEYHYMIRAALQFSGWNDSTQKFLEPHIDWMQKNLKLYYTIQYPNTFPILATHAGVHQYYYQQFDNDFQRLLTNLDDPKKRESWYFNIGNARGGSSRYGGPLWCDWDKEFNPPAGIIQIVGHTKGPVVREKGSISLGSPTAYCIDCLKQRRALKVTRETITAVTLDTQGNTIDVDPLWVFNTKETTGEIIDKK